jgi:glutathione S-transferase
MATMTLYQFAISHFCEKARWALDYKGLAYRLHNLVPGPHLRVTRRLAPQSTVPILIDGEVVTQGSGAIITYLDRQYRARPLTPTVSTDAGMALEWERYADNNIGIPLRVYFYHYVLADRALATRLLTDGGPWWSSPLYALIYPVLRSRMRSALRIDAESARAAEARLVEALVHLEERLARRRYLAGPMFSRADLAVSALLAPCWREPHALPAPLQRFIATHSERPALRWARQIYSDHRMPAALT